MLPRFYAPDLDRDLGSVTLPPDEARHLTRVLRLAAGDEVVVFDGRGVEFRAVVEAAVRETASLRLIEALPSVAVLPVSLVVVQAVLKGGSMDDAIRDATMMGAAAIEPVLTAHTDVKASFVSRPETLERWRRVALASTKQCRRATLPAVHPPQPLEAWFGRSFAGTMLMFVEPSAAGGAQPVRSLLDDPTPDVAAILLGPEGGWAESEIAIARGRGCLAMTLGPLTLRAESMPVAALAALTGIWSR